MRASFLLIAFFLMVAYLAPIVLVASLIFLGLPRLRQLGVRILQVGAAGAVGGALAALLIGLALRQGASGRGVLAAAGFGFTVAGLAITAQHARKKMHAI